jgi:predicted RNA-binding Zn-ribbon protein involved in translation (DUF1610 family)
MASRDHFYYDFICPQCGENGRIHWSENDYPFMKHHDRRLEKLEGNFSGSMLDEKDALITCKSCGNKFKK